MNNEKRRRALELMKKYYGGIVESENKIVPPELETVSISGTILNFNTDISRPLENLILHLEPTQSGSGDPSPDNVRPITGWTGAKVTRTGKNLLDVDKYGSTLPRTQNGITWSKVGDEVYHVSGTATGNSHFNVSFITDLASAMPVVGFHGKSLYLSTTNLGISISIGYFRKDGSFSNLRNGSVLPDEAVALRAYLSIRDGTTIDTDFSVQLELGSTATAYEPYQGETYDTTFPSEAGTVYGGTLDVTNGVLTVDRAQIASYAGEALPSTWISDRDVYASGTTPTIGAQVVYKLATPIIYQLTPIEVTTLLGDNTIWMDAEGTIDAKYWRIKH